MDHSGGADHSGKSKPLTDEEMNNYFTDLEAALVRGGSDVSAIKGKSFAEIQTLMLALSKEADGPAAPDADTFAAIKAAAKKGARK